MAYYDGSGQWLAPAQNAWDHHAPTPIRPAGASGPQPQDEYAFLQQFEEIDRALDNLSKNGKAYGMVAARREFSGSLVPGLVKHHSRMNTLSGPAPRPHSMNAFDEIRNNHGGPGLQNFYASQRHVSSRGSNEAEQVMQAKRRMAAQRERELRNHHMEQQFQRTVTADPSFGPKAMSEEQTRQLIARQRSVLYREGQFSDSPSYVDETGALRQGLPGLSGPSSLRGQSPMTYDVGRANPPADVMTTGAPVAATAAAAAPISAVEAAHQAPPPVGPIGHASLRADGTTSPQPIGTAAAKPAFEAVDAPTNRTSASSPANSAQQDLAAGSKVAPIGTRPTGTPVGTASAASASSTKRSTTPLASPSWPRGSSNLWGSSSGLNTQASVWG